MTRLAKQLPWDHPIARTLNHEVHRRKMAGKSCRFFDWQDSVPSFTHTLFFLGGGGVCSGVSRSRLSLAHPPLPSIELGSVFLGPRLFVLIFLSQIP